MSTNDNKGLSAQVIAIIVMIAITAVSLVFNVTNISKVNRIDKIELREDLQDIKLAKQDMDLVVLQGHNQRITYLENRVQAVETALAILQVEQRYIKEKVDEIIGLLMGAK
jgi:hypothetical protein